MKKEKVRKYVVIGAITIVLGILSFMMYQSYAYYKVNYSGNIINTTVGVFSITAFLAGEPLSSPTATSIFWRGPIGRDTVEEITFTTTNEVPAGVIGSWDAGEEKNGKVMAWYTDTNVNGKYEVVAGAKGGVYAPENSIRLFYRFQNLVNLNLTNLNTSQVINMRGMFMFAGNDSSLLTLNLGDNFDTSKVTNMHDMFSQTGYNATSFTLNLGDKFDTSNVTNMQSMFNHSGRNSINFTLDLGDKFDTSNVTNMITMFYYTGYSSTVFHLDLGNSFDTSSVTDMSYMFDCAGRSSTIYTLDLGNNFNTSKVTSTTGMFNQAGFSNTNFTLDLGDKFDTSKVTNMDSMFYCTGYNSPVFTLDLGDKFDTSKVTNMLVMFASTGISNPNFILDLRQFTFNNPTTDINTFLTYNTSHKLYASASNITFISDPNKGFRGTIINCTTNPASCPQ